MMNKIWKIHTQSTDEKRALAEELDISLILAHLLLNRGLRTPEAGQSFLRPRLSELHDPFMFKDMEKAALRVKDAVMGGEKILIYGDYDVDGITATALLHSFFRHVGAESRFYIPHRIKEGYSLHVEAIDEAVENNVSLIISVDCGVTNVPEVKYATDKGLDVIITDHHEPGDELPGALAIIDAKLKGSRYPFRSLAGVGVAFKLAWAVAQSFSPERKVSDEMRSFLTGVLAFVSLGTIADVVPLLGENRIFSRHGLKYVEESTNPGIRAILDICGLSRDRLQSRDVAFRIAPRINAAGRMGKSALGIELFTTTSTQRANEIAAELDRQNQLRQQIEREILEEAYRNINTQADSGRNKAFVLSSENWHVGVIGIVASRLVEEHHKPVVMIAVEDGKGKGSARSIPGLPLHEVLGECRDLLTAFGGHSLAAGLEMPVENIDTFRETFLDKVSQRMDDSMLQPEMSVDMEVLFSSLTSSLVFELDQLAPHGEKNPPPLFASYGVRVAGKPKIVGRDGKHLSFYARQGELSFKAIAFNQAGVLPEIEKKKNFAVVYRPFISSWQGREAVELDVKDFSFD